MKLLWAVIAASVAVSAPAAEDVKKLLGMLDSAPTPSSFIFAAKKLGELGEKSIVPKLTAKIDKIKDSEKEEDIDLVEELVGIIAELKDRGSVMYLSEMMGHKNPRVRRVALYALGEIGDETPFPDIIGLMLSERDFTMKREAAVALGKMNLKELAPVFAKTYSDQDPGVRAALIIAMQRLKDPAVNAVMKEEMKYENVDWLKERIGWLTGEGVKK